MEDEQHVSTFEDDDKLIVDKILYRRVRRGRVEYFVKWKGFSDADNCWEQADNLDCFDIIQHFEENLLKEKQKKTRASSKKSMNHQPIPAEKEAEQQIIKAPKTRLEVKKSHQEVATKATEKEVTKKAANNKTKSLCKNNNELVDQDNDNNEPDKIMSTENVENSKEITTAPEPYAQIKQINGKNRFVSDFLNRYPPAKTGFEKGLKPEEIVGATKVNGCLYLIIKFENDDELHMVQNNVANEAIPQMVIKFYEERLWWQSDNEN